MAAIEPLGITESGAIAYKLQDLSFTAKASPLSQSYLNNIPSPIMEMGKKKKASFSTTTISMWDEELKTVFEHVQIDGCVAGGAARLLFCGDLTAQEPRGDIDIFPFSKQKTGLILGRMLVSGFSLVNDTDYAYTLIRELEPMRTVQIIKNPGTVLETLRQFDLTPTMFAVYKIDGGYEVTYEQEGYEDVKARKLHLRAVRNPIICINRIAYYMDKGYNIESKDMQSLFMRIANASPTQLELWHKEVTGDGVKKSGIKKGYGFG